MTTFFEAPSTEPPVFTPFPQWSVEPVGPVIGVILSTPPATSPSRRWRELIGQQIVGGELLLISEAAPIVQFFTQVASKQAYTSWSFHRQSMHNSIPFPRMAPHHRLLMGNLEQQPHHHHHHHSRLTPSGMAG